RDLVVYTEYTSARLDAVRRCEGARPGEPERGARLARRIHELVDLLVRADFVGLEVLATHRLRGAVLVQLRVFHLGGDEPADVDAGVVVECGTQVQVSGRRHVLERGRRGILRLRPRSGPARDDDTEDSNDEDRIAHGVLNSERRDF